MKFDRSTFNLSETGRLSRTFFWLGITGLAFSAIGLTLNPERGFQAYLIAFTFWLTLALGALFFVLLQHLTGAVWSIVLRRLAETLMANFTWLALLFLPLLIGIPYLYPWSQAEVIAPDPVLQHKAAYLNLPFFILRTVVYFGLWIWLSRSLYRTSLAQDVHPTESRQRRFGRLSAPGMILFALTCTFAAIDWLMSLDPHWQSTIFGVYVFAGAVTAALSGIILITIVLQKKGVLSSEISAEHYHDLGKLIFAFMILWSYMAFSQYFLIWYANLPEETLWYRHRWESGWKGISLLLPFGHFVIPFIVLMSRAAKRNRTVLTLTSLWLLIMHWIDLSWLILPSFDPQHVTYSWMDLTATLGLGGLFLWAFWRRLSAQAIVPKGDPRLTASLKFINS